MKFWKPEPNVSWHEPRWSKNIRWRNECRQFRSSLSWVRIVLASAVVYLLIVGVIQQRFPNLQFDWAVALIKSILIIAVLIVFQLGINWLIPLRIEVTSKRIITQTGQTTRLLRMEQIDSVHIATFPENRRVLWITLSTHSRYYAIADKVKEHELQNLFCDKWNAAALSGPRT